jgi:hypothetical protein
MAESLTGMAEALRWKSLAANSQDKYKGYWTHALQLGAFAVFTMNRWRSPKHGGIPHAAFFFLYGWNTRERGNQHGTIASKISAIRWHHRALVGYEPDRCGACPIDAGTRCSKPVAKHPLTARMLRGIFGLLDMSQSGHQLLWGLLLIGYVFLLRRGELLKVDGKWEKYVLLFGDAQFYDGNERPCKVRHATMVVIVLRGEKNNQFGRNEKRYQFAAGDPLLCPVRGLAWIRIANRAHKTQPWEPIARPGPNHEVENGHIVQLLKEVAATLGLNPANYSTHSIRIGRSTALLNGGANRW